MNLVRRIMRWFSNEQQPTTTGTMSVVMNAAGDGWIQVARIGDYPHAIGLQRVRPEDLAACLADIENQRAEAGTDWTGIPFYAEPAHPRNGDGPALAWAKDWRIAANALECRPEWSPEGRRRILENKEFKRVSISWGCILDNSDKTWHPAKVLHIGLTNAPVMTDLPPVVNTRTDLADQASGGAAPEAPAGASATPRTPATTGADSAGAGAPPKSAPALVPVPAHNGAPERLSVAPAQAPAQTQGGEVRGDEFPRPGSQGPAAPAAAAPTATAPVPVVPAVLSRIAELERDLARVRAELVAERAVANGAIVDRLIARRRIHPAKREQAMAIVANNRADALAVWEGDADAAARPPSPSATPPADPLAGRVLDNAGLATPRPLCGADLADIAKRARELCAAQPGLSYERAHDQAWTAFVTGRRDPA